MSSINYQDFITIESGKRSGKPCIRGLRITVQDIIEYLASGMSQDEILDDFDYLTKERGFNNIRNFTILLIGYKH